MATRPDVLLVNPSSHAQVYQGLGKNLVAIEPPVWLVLIASHLRAKGFSVEALDAEAEFLSPAQAVEKVRDANPRLVAVVVYGQQPSASTQNMAGASLFVSTMKSAHPEFPVILVGGHVSALPLQTMEEEQADFVCQGEGPRTLAALLRTDLRDALQLSKVPGLWYRDSGRIASTPLAPLILQEEMDAEMPGDAYDLLPMQNYRAHNWHCFGDIAARQPYASLYTSLGCPFHCSFCCINAPFGKNTFRHWSVESTLAKFDLLAGKFGVRNIKISDEMFVLKDQHFLRLCERLAERDYGLNIWCYARIDTLREHHLKIMRAAGVRWVVLGIESHSAHVRIGADKGKFNENAIGRVVRSLQDEGINAMGNYIFGLPDDEQDSMKATLEMAMGLGCDWANFYCAMAYPGSALHATAIKNGWELPSTWAGYSQHAFETLPLPSQKLSAGEILAFRDYAWKTYFTDPAYLERVLRKFGKETHDHVVEMTRYSMKRQHAVGLL